MVVHPGRRSFVIKAGAAIVLVVVADVACDAFRMGSWLGLFALLWCALLVVARPAMRHGRARIAVIVAACFAAVLCDGPQALAWILFWCALSFATLSPRAGPFDDAWQWLRRLAMHAMTSPFAAPDDLKRILRPHRKATFRSRHAVGLLAVPVAGTLLFLALFAGANPLIERAFTRIDLPPLGEVVFWFFALTAVWPSLRPRAHVARSFARSTFGAIARARIPIASVVLSLVAFNAVFALENGLDLVFLWSGAPLPAGVTLADYAHRGAYPLIATALLAGLFVVTTLEPGSTTAANRTVRRLVVAWIAQNLLLVASSILRTCLYIAAYMLTPWRIAALAWMGLVALGLVLICWRLLEKRSTRWLINANALAAVALLSTMTLVDLDGIAARWNIAHARELGGGGVQLDLCQLGAMGAPALIPLIELEQRLPETGFRDRVRAVRRRILDGDASQPSLQALQLDWRTWTWRNARRLASAESSFGAHPALPETLPAGWYRACDGLQRPPSPDGLQIQPDP